MTCCDCSKGGLWGGLALAVACLVGAAAWHEKAPCCINPSVAPDCVTAAEEADSPADAIGADWPLFRGNALQTGVSPAKMPTKLAVHWQFKTGDAVEGTAAIANGVVYVGSFDEHLYAIDLATANQKWKSKLGPIKSAVAVRGDRVYVGDADGKFYCVKASDGTKVWTFETGGEITAGANFLGDRVLIGSHDNTLYCLSKDGEKLWEFKTEGPVNGSPAVAKDRTFVAGCDSVLHVLKIEDGKETAAIDLGGQAGATAALHGDKLYVGTMTNQVLGIDLAKEKIEWAFEAEKRKQPFYASAAVTDDLVVVGGRDKRVYGLDRATGREVWSYLTKNRVDGSPVVAGKRVYVGSTDEHFYVLNLADGTLVQDIKLDGSILGSPAVVDGAVVIGTEKGTVYCFGKE
jgi:outer membrane protein assembly factor BamB